jgi:hypothetical protein
MIIPVGTVLCPVSFCCLCLKFEFSKHKGPSEASLPLCAFYTSYFKIDEIENKESMKCRNGLLRSCVSDKPVAFCFLYTAANWRRKRRTISTIAGPTMFHTSSSVNMRLGYGLEDRGSIPARGNEGIFFSLHHRVQTGSGVHPTGTRGSF